MERAEKASLQLLHQVKLGKVGLVAKYELFSGDLEGMSILAMLKNMRNQGKHRWRWISVVLQPLCKASKQSCRVIFRRLSEKRASFGDGW